MGLHSIGILLALPTHVRLRRKWVRLYKIFKKRAVPLIHIKNIINLVCSKLEPLTKEKIFLTSSNICDYLNGAT
jgi:hypothetical protein